MITDPQFLEALRVAAILSAFYLIINFFSVYFMRTKQGRNSFALTFAAIVIILIWVFLTPDGSQLQLP